MTVAHHRLRPPSILQQLVRQLVGKLIGALFVPVFHAGTAAAMRDAIRQHGPGCVTLNRSLGGGACQWEADADAARRCWPVCTMCMVPAITLAATHIIHAGPCSLERSAWQWGGAAAGGGPHRGRDRRQDCGNGGTPRFCCLLQPAAKAPPGAWSCLLQVCWPCRAGALVDWSSRHSCGCLVVHCTSHLDSRSHHMNIRQPARLGLCSCSW